MQVNPAATEDESSHICEILKGIPYFRDKQMMKFRKDKGKTEAADAQIDRS